MSQLQSSAPDIRIKASLPFVSPRCKLANKSRYFRMATHEKRHQMATHEKGIQHKKKPNITFKPLNSLTLQQQPTHLKAKKIYPTKTVSHEVS